MFDHYRDSIKYLYGFTKNYGSVIPNSGLGGIFKGGIMNKQATSGVDSTVHSEIQH